MKLPGMHISSRFLGRWKRDLYALVGKTGLAVVAIAAILRRVIVTASVVILVMLGIGVGVILRVLEPLTRVLHAMLSRQASVHQPMREGVGAPALGVHARVFVRFAHVFLLML